jgi:predicted ATPase
LNFAGCETGVASRGCDIIQLASNAGDRAVSFINKSKRSAQVSPRQASLPLDADTRAAVHESVAWARRQGALSWELRTSISFARLLIKEHRINEARDLLAPGLDRFVEGFETMDLQIAKQLIQDLA